MIAKYKIKHINRKFFFRGIFFRIKKKPIINEQRKKKLVIKEKTNTKKYFS